MTSIDEKAIWDQFSQALNLNEETQGEIIPDSHPQNKKRECENCNADESNHFCDSAAGHTVCTKCGWVISEHIIDDGAEWNNYSDDFGQIDNGERCGPALDITNPYDNLGTWTPSIKVVCYTNDGTKIIKNLQKTAIRTTYTSKQRAFNEGKYAFETVVTNLNLAHFVLQQAKIFWGVILQTDILTRGANRRGLKAVVCITPLCVIKHRGREMRL